MVASSYAGSSSQQTHCTPCVAGERFCTPCQVSKHSRVSSKFIQHVSERLSVCPGVCPVSTVSNQPMDGTLRRSWGDKLTVFWTPTDQGQGHLKVRYEKVQDPYLLNGSKHHNQIWGQSQGHSKVKHRSELLWMVEVTTWMLGHCVKVWSSFPYNSDVLTVKGKLEKVALDGS